MDDNIPEPRNTEQGAGQPDEPPAPVSTSDDEIPTPRKPANPVKTPAGELIAVPNEIDALAETVKQKSHAVALIVKDTQAPVPPPSDISIISAVGGVLLTAIGGGLCAVMSAPVVVTMLVCGAGVAATVGGGMDVARALIGKSKQKLEEMERKGKLEAAQGEVLAAMRAMWTEQNRFANEREILVEARAKKLFAAASQKIDELFPDSQAKINAQATFKDPDRPGDDIHLVISNVKSKGSFGTIESEIAFRLYEVLPDEDKTLRELDFMSPMTIQRKIKFEVPPDPVLAPGIPPRASSRFLFDPPAPPPIPGVVSEKFLFAPKADQPQPALEKPVVPAAPDTAPAATPPAAVTPVSPEPEPPTPGPAPVHPSAAPATEAGKNPAPPPAP